MRTVLITGTTSGIGKVTALELARQGDRVVMANRNQHKSEELVAQIKADTGNDNVSFIPLDLASLDSVRRCAADFLAQYDSLDVLLNNAGLTSADEVITDDGFELQFEVNGLSQFLLTRELLPALEKAAPAQVVFVSSMMHKFGKLDYDSFKGWETYNANSSYMQSKLVISMLAREFAERLAEKKIAVNTLHPGAVNTGILDGYSKFAQFFLRKLFVAPEKGAKTSLYLLGLSPATMPTGKYFVSCKPAKAHKMLEDAAARERLWDACTGLL